MNFLEPKEDEKKNHIQDIISKMGEVPTAAIVSAVTGNPMALLAAIGTVGINIGIGHFFSNRESERFQRFIEVVNEGIDQRKKNHEVYRQDGFLEETSTSESKVKESMESILKKVRDTTEAPKTDYLGYLTVHVVYDEDLDIDTIRRVLKYLDELPYRQLCIIKMCKNIDNIDVENFGNPETITKLGSILGDFFELRDKGFIDRNSLLMRKFEKLYVGSSGDYITAGGDSPELSGFADQNGFFSFPSDVLFKFADLDKIPDKDVDTILQELKKRAHVEHCNESAEESEPHEETNE